VRTTDQNKERAVRRRAVLSGSLPGSALLMTAALGARGAMAQSPSSSRRLPDADYLEIQQLYARYCHVLDRGQGEEFAACFTEDGEFTGGRGPGEAKDARTPLKGRSVLAAAGVTGGTRHFTANLTITATSDPNTAKGSVYLLLYTARTSPPTFVETAIYDDTLVKTPEGWKFKKRVVWRDDDDITPFKPKPLPPGRQP
jgi:3-phenylpropionate/cinnamic acid dioxygenase small subunit